ncbi:MAG: hypothetical protein Q7I89_02580 [Syntrophales bacterium]|nr:hypothetical protein [Syntrophales bacterium]
MGKKKYVRPDIREESQILTVRAWVTKTQYVLSLENTPTTSTSVSSLDTYVAAVQAVSESSYAVLSQLTESNVALQTAFTRVNYALQNVFTRLAQKL